MATDFGEGSKHHWVSLLMFWLVLALLFLMVVAIAVRSIFYRDMAGSL